MKALDTIGLAFVLSVATQAAIWASDLDIVSIAGHEPTEKETAQIAHTIGAFLKSAEGDPARTISDLSTYRLQLQVESAGEGRRVVLVNGVCRDHWEHVLNWVERFVVVLDGGKCFFIVKFESETGRFFDLWVNGDA